MKRLFVVAICLFVVACTPAGFEPAAPGAGEVPVTRPTGETTPEPVWTPTRVEPPTVSYPPALQTPTPPPTPVVGITPTATPCAVNPCPPITPTPVPPFPGMVYRDAQGTWLTDGDWQPRLLTARTDVSLAPDLARGLYIENGDVFVLDLATGEATNVTAGSGRGHTYALWWPARPETLVLGSQGDADVGPNNGHLTLVNVDGSDYQVVSAESVSFAMPAPGPDGRTIAYDEAGQGMLYTVGEGTRLVDFAALGVPPEVTVARAASPSWSPDGAKLAWVMGLQDGGYGGDYGWDIVVGVFDLAAQTAQLRLEHPAVGRGGWFDAAKWSADGQWLAFFVETPGTGRGLWLLAADGSSERPLGVGYIGPSVWVPVGDEPWQDPDYLVYHGANPNGDVGYWLVDVNSDYRIGQYLPAGATLVGWHALP